MHIISLLGMHHVCTGACVCMYVCMSACKHACIDATVSHAPDIPYRAVTSLEIAYSMCVCVYIYKDIRVCMHTPTKPYRTARRGLLNGAWLLSHYITTREYWQLEEQNGYESSPWQELGYRTQNWNLDTHVHYTHTYHLTSWNVQTVSLCSWT